MTVHLPDIGNENQAATSVVLPQPSHPIFTIYRSFFKRAFETILVLMAAPVILLLVAICAVIVASDGNNPFYTQERIGRHGRLLKMWKLRTMVPGAHEKLQEYLAQNPAARQEWDLDQKLKNDPRITRVGHILRKTSLDELPQLWNVLNGTMSLIGPRPMMVEQQNMYMGKAYYRLRPGITGLWQVSERNDCRFTDRVRFDEAYDRHVSFLTDVSILWRTIKVVIKGTGY